MIGDFTLVGIFGGFIVTDRVRSAFDGRFAGLSYLLPEMVQDKSLRKPKRPTSRTHPRVWLPYEGPPLWEVAITAEFPIEETASKVRLIRCETCHGVRIVGPPHTERHLVVDERVWTGEDFFQLDCARALHCTETAKSFIEASGFTNTLFVLAGEIRSL